MGMIIMLHLSKITPTKVNNDRRFVKKKKKRIQLERFLLYMVTVDHASDFNRLTYIHIHIRVLYYVGF